MNKNRWFWVCGIVILVVIAVIIPVSIYQHNKWVRWCHSQGGRVDYVSTPYTSFDANGKPSTSYHTTYYCFAGDGRVLGVRG